MIFMMLGALSFAVVAQVHKGNWREFVRDIEVRTLALWTVGMVVVFVSAVAAGNFLTDYSALMRRGIFTIISATTNTGFQVLTTTQITTMFSTGAFLLLAVSMAIGGSSASTAGGIKALRVGLVFKGIGLHIRRIMQPRSAHITAHYNHIGRHQLAPELLSSALIIASLYVISYVFGALVGIAYGYEALNATFESVSAASNAGLSSGIVKLGMPVPLEVIYILQMWLGRLEFITLLALFASFVASLLPRRKPRKNAKGTTEQPLGAQEPGTKGSVGTKAAVVALVLLLLALVCAPLQSAYGATEEVTVGELTQAPEYLDNTEVEFEGEVVGDRINADEDQVWITLNDGSGAITVLMPRELEQQIEYYGSYAYEGTHLRITGEFRLACAQHYGVSDVHATSIVAVTETGHARKSAVDPLLLGEGIVLIAAAFGLWGFYSFLSRKRR